MGSVFSASWENIITGGGVPTLQQVINTGNAISNLGALLINILFLLSCKKI